MKLLETALLFVLVLNTFRAFSITNLVVIGIVAFSLAFFIFFSLPNYAKSKVVEKSRFSIFLIVVFVVHGFILSQQIINRRAEGDAYRVHDGVLQTELAVVSLAEGKNPYAISYKSVFVGKGYYPEGKETPVVSHYDYSPVMFYATFPFAYSTEYLFNFVDMRFALVIFLLASAICASFIVKEKILFLIIYLFNPLFLPLTYFGANDSILLFFIVFGFVAVFYKKYTAATVSIALAFGTKLTVAPILPLFFLYLLFLSKKDKSLKLSRQFIYFLVTSLLIYLPFVIWDFGSLFDDLIAYVFLGGSQNHPIVGYFGLQQLLLSTGIISDSTVFPFYVLLLPVAVIFLLFSYKILRDFLNLATFCVLYVLFSLILIFFSKVLQTNYLAYLSQILILSGLVQITTTKRS